MKTVDVGKLANGGDLQFGHVATETFGFMEAFTALEFESNALWSAKLIDNLRLHSGSTNEWSTDCHIVAFTTKQNFGEFNYGIDFCIELLDIEFVAFLDAVLFTACFDYCVGHGRLGKSCCPLTGGRGIHHTSTHHASIF